MDLLWGIVLQSVEIFALILGVIGMILSFFLMLAPERTGAFSNLFNHWIHFDESLAFLDFNMKTDHFIFRHHVASGVVMIAGSVFFLIFLFFKLDIARITEIFFQGGRLPPITEVGLYTAIIIGKLAGFIGIVLGVFLLFAAGKIRDIENKMASGLTTQPFFNKLNEFHGGVDTILLRYPVVFGLFGLAASILLILLSSVFIMN